MTESEGQLDPPSEPMPLELEAIDLPSPDLPGEVVVALTDDKLIDHLAADLIIHAENCVREFGDFHLALSGGQTFDRLYQRLMYDPNCRRLPWRRTHLWFVEECCVAFDDAESNYKQIRETIGDHADIPREQFHPIFAEVDTAAEDYEATLRETLAWREKGQDRLDYVLLTAGEDGSIVGLLPGSSLLTDEKRLIGRARPSETSRHDRITMTLPFINASRFIAVLITGENKAGVVQRMTDHGEHAHDLPVNGLAPFNGELKWYLDAPACPAVE